MGLLETRYRRAFHPHEGSYLFRQWGTDVRFEPHEVEALVAAWRAVWANPWFWAGYALFGLVLPGMLVAGDYAVAAFMLALLATLSTIVALVHVSRQRNGEAKMRIPIGTEKVEAEVPSGWLILGWAFPMLMISSASDPWYYSPWPWLALLWTGNLATILLNRRRKRQGRPNLFDSPGFAAGWRLWLVATLLGAVASLTIRPDADWFDYGLAGAVGLCALSILFDLARGKPLLRHEGAEPIRG